MMKKFVAIPMTLVCVVSLAANVFFIKNYDEKAIEEVQSDTKYIQQLEAEIDTLKTSLSVISKNTNETASVQTLESVTKIEAQAIDFIEHVYNVTLDNYVDKKQTARQFMSKNLFETLYTADGIDPVSMDTETRVKDVNVFQHTKDMQAFVKYTIQVKQLSTNIITEENHTMILYFGRESGQIIVEAIEPLNDMGAI